MSMKGPWDDNWEVIEKNFGKGGQGMTHLVRSKEAPGQKAVLKVLKHNKSVQARGRMHREVASLETMVAAGGNVPDVLEHNTQQFQDDRVQLYLIMEYVSGPTLEELVKESGGLSLEDSIQIARDICRTVQKGHAADVLHRDLKPQNLIVDRSEKQKVTILDYGLSFNAAQADEELTRTSEDFANKFLDLPETNTPSGDHRNVRSDITAICGVLYYCLTGQRPGQLRDGKGVAPHKRSGHSVREKLGEDYRLNALDSLFDRGFSQDLDSRFESVEELLKRLDSVSSGARIAPRDPATLAQRATELLRRADRKVLLADFAQRSQGLLGQLTQYVGELSHKTASHLIGIQGTTRGRLELPSGVEQVKIPALVVTVSVQYHPIRATISYAFGVRGDRCSVFRTFNTLATKKDEAQSSERDELMSFERNEEPTIEALKQDLDMNVGKAIDFITRTVTGQGVL